MTMSPTSTGSSRLMSYIVAAMPDKVPMVVETHRSGRMRVRKVSADIDAPVSEKMGVPVVTLASWEGSTGGSGPQASIRMASMFALDNI